MPGYDQGGGGGKAPLASFTLNNRYALAKPYELEGEMTSEKMAHLNEMLLQLYSTNEQLLTSLIEGDIINIETGVAGGSDITGPGASISSEIALFNGTAGDLLKRATGTGIVHATAGVYSVANVALASEVTGALPFTNVEQIATQRVLGRSTAGTGVIEPIAIGSGLTLASGILSGSSGDGGGGGASEAVIKNVTQAEIESLFTTPVVVKAGIANEILVPVFWSVFTNVTIAYSSIPRYRLRFIGDTNVLLGDIDPTFNTVSTNLQWRGAAIANFTSNAPIGAGFEITLTANPTGAGAATSRVSVFYMRVSSVGYSE